MGKLKWLKQCAVIEDGGKCFASVYIYGMKNNYFYVYVCLCQFMVITV